MGFDYSDDPDDSAWIDEANATVHRFPDLPEHVAKAFPNTGKTRGQPPKGDARKLDIKLRIDPDVVEAFKADGPG